MNDPVAALLQKTSPLQGLVAFARPACGDVLTAVRIHNGPFERACGRLVPG